MDMYEPLYRLLKEQPSAVHKVTLTLKQVASIIGRPHLPDSAYIYDGWWANNEHRHSQAVWVQAGWKASVHRVRVGTSGARVIASVTFTRATGPVRQTVTWYDLAHP